MTQNIAQLHEGNMLVRLMPLEPGWPPPSRLITPRMVPTRFEQYEESLPESAMVTDMWERVGYNDAEGNWVTVEFWVEHFKISPPEYTDTFLVPVCWWKYELVS